MGELCNSIIIPMIIVVVMTVMMIRNENDQDNNISIIKNTDLRETCINFIPNLIKTF